MRGNLAPRQERRKSEVEVGAERLAQMATSDGGAEAIVKNGGMDSLLTTVKSRRSSHLEIASSSRAISALAISGGGEHVDSIMGEGEVIDALAEQIEDLGAQELGDLAYFKEIERRQISGVATAEELQHLESRYAEQQDLADQEDARAEASMAIMSLASSAENIEKISINGGVAAVLSALKTNPANKRHSLLAMDFVSTLAAEESFDTDQVVEVGGIEAVAQGMSANPEDADIQLKALEALACLASDEENVINMVLAGTVSLLVVALTKHSANAELVSNALFLMSLLNLVESGADGIDEAGAMFVLCDALFAHRQFSSQGSADLCDSEQAKEAIEALFVDEHITSLLDELWNRAAEMKITAEQNTKAMRRSSVSEEAAEAVLQEAAQAKNDDEEDPTALLEDILSMVKALHAASVVSVYTKLMIENGGAITIATVLDRASLQLQSSRKGPLFTVRRDISEGCTLLLYKMSEESGMEAFTAECAHALANSAKAFGSLECHVPTAVALLLRIKSEVGEEEPFEGYEEMVKELRSFPRLLPALGGDSKQAARKSSKVASLFGSSGQTAASVNLKT